MKHYMVDIHSNKCGEHIDTIGGNIIPTCCNSHILFYLNSEYHIITLKSCNYNRFHDENKYWFSQLFKSKKKYDRHDYTESINLNYQLSKIAKSGFQFRDYITEVNYIYSGGGKQYCWITKYPFIEKLFSEGFEDYLKTIEYVNNNDDLRHLKNDVENLWKHNTIYNTFLDEMKVVKTIDELVKTIKNKTK